MKHHPTPQVFVPPKLLDEIISNESADFALLRSSENPEAELRANIGMYNFPYELVRPYLERFDRPRLLELGSGNGLALCALLMRGLDVVGIEPGAEPFRGRYDVAREILKVNGRDSTRIHSAVAEELPFLSDSFDIVFSVSVLEHVGDPAAAMDEVLRVLAPGGVAITHVPNYDSFWEGHYGIVWLPYVLRSKSLARRYVRSIYGRDPAFVDTLNFVRPGWFKGWAASRGVQVRIFPFLFSHLNKVAAARYLLAQDLGSEYAMLNWARRSQRVRQLGAAVAGVTTDLAAMVGLAPALTAVLTKPHPDGSPARTRRM